MDPVAINYDSEAKKDDHSCFYPTKVRINSAVFQFGESNNSGIPWDIDGSPDILYTTEYGQLVNGGIWSGDYCDWNLDLLSPVSIDNSSGILTATDFLTMGVVNTSCGIRIKFYDQDGSTDQLMQEVVFKPYNYSETNVVNPIFPETLVFTDQDAMVTCTLSLSWLE